MRLEINRLFTVAGHMKLTSLPSDGAMAHAQHTHSDGAMAHTQHTHS